MSLSAFLFLTILFPATYILAALCPYGELDPPGNIIIVAGSTLNLSCRLTKFREDFSDLSFARTGQKFKGLQDLEHIVLNDTAIQLHVENVTADQSGNYMCLVKAKDGPRAICMASVKVGFPPHPPEKLRCISENLERLVCTWNAPLNPIPTNYSIHYFLPTPSSPRMACPETSRLRNGCEWTLTSSPIYMANERRLLLQVTAANVLDSVIFPVVNFDHYANVRVAPVEQLSAQAQSSSAVTLTWRLPMGLLERPELQVNHSIHWRAEWDESEDWKVIDVTLEQSRDQKYILRKLPFAHTVYYIRVRSISASAESPDLWSNFSATHARTMSEIPKSPQTIENAFEVEPELSLDSRSVYIYWKHLLPEEENGGDFRYMVNVEEEGFHKPLSASNSSQSYVKYEGLKQERAYTFLIQSVNDQGPSQLASRVRLPRATQIVPAPRYFTAVLYPEQLADEETLERIVELSWKSPQEGVDVDSYTIFWCKHKEIWPKKCRGYLSWDNVPGHDNLANVSLRWHRDDEMVSRLREVWMKESRNDSLSLGWHLECSNRVGVIQGFLISYCVVSTEKPEQCLGPQGNVTVTGETETGVVHDLNPSSTYKLTVRVISRAGLSLPNDPPLLSATQEGVPEDAPKLERVENVTSSSMVLYFRPPNQPNGKIRYGVTYFDGIHHSSFHLEKRDWIKVTGLQSYWNYSVQLSLCTVNKDDACSPRSKPLIVATLIDAPGEVSAPLVRFANDSTLLVSWEPPSEKNGPIDFYELDCVRFEDDQSSIIPTVLIYTTQTSIQVPECDSEKANQKYIVSVRAVNMRGEEFLSGNWSSVATLSCTSALPKSVLYGVVVGAALLAVLIFLVIFICKRAKKRLEKMKNVQVTLPKGFQQEDGCVGINPLTGEKAGVFVRSESTYSEDFKTRHDSGCTTISGDSTDKLLHKRKKTKSRFETEENTSGCSSGKDIESEQNADKNRISGDSGADIDTIPESPSSGFEGYWKGSNVTQRRPSEPCLDSSGLSCASRGYVKAGLSSSHPSILDSSGSSSTPCTMQTKAVTHAGEGHDGYCQLGYGGYGDQTPSPPPVGSTSPHHSPKTTIENLIDLPIIVPSTPPSVANKLSIARPNFFGGGYVKVGGSLTEDDDFEVPEDEGGDDLSLDYIPSEQDGDKPDSGYVGGRWDPKKATAPHSSHSNMSKPDSGYIGSYSHHHLDDGYVQAGLPEENYLPSEEAQKPVMPMINNYVEPEVHNKSRQGLSEYVTTYT
ncbi:unnamed protein product [Darwinula stevensoni]|uniref:Uncharacterized protein n=1 Tax=Darwinula stevensoni TaxID=69355 RepID=A0A7R9AB41_9CRUS|nr:unnamed protein product [Darwinula stevensoni]CAG0898712.1 unnamed protein product [Darwinula stevensoni]